MNQLDEQVEMFNAIIRQYRYNHIIVIYKFTIEATSQRIILPPLLNNQIKQCIINNIALAACDASVKNGRIGAYWVLVDTSIK